MAQIQPEPITGKTKRKVHAAITIDMTPMVDLGFLLITFFIFTTTMAEQRVSKLLMPKESLDSTNLKEKNALTAILAGNNKVFAFVGQWQEAVKNKRVIETNYNLYQGLGNIIRARQKSLRQDKDKLMLLIKPLNDASYQNVIDALDEALINDVKRYAIVEATKDEKIFVEGQ